MNQTVESWIKVAARSINLKKPYFINYTPSCDVEETSNNYVISIDLPGVARKDVQVNAQERDIIVSGERHKECSEATNHGHVHECFEGRFSRSITLPTAFDADKVEAQFKDGVLKIFAPKLELTKGRRVKVLEGTSVAAS